MAERVFSEFGTERRLTQDNDPSDRSRLKYWALLALDYESYVSVAFDLGKLVDVIHPGNGFSETSIYHEIRHMRTDVRHAHEPLKSNASTWIQVNGVCLRWSKPKGNVFNTRTFQDVHRDITTARRKHGLEGESLAAFVERLDSEKQEIEFPGATPDMLPEI